MTEKKSPTAAQKVPYFNKGDVILSLLVSLAFAFNIFVFAPLDSYFAAQDELWFSPASVLPIIALCFLGGAVLCFGVCLLAPKKIRWIPRWLIFSATLALYVDGNFLMQGYPVLDGSKIQWNAMGDKVLIMVMVWAVLFVIPLVLYLVKKMFFCKVVQFVAFLLLAMEIVTLTITVFTAPLISTQIGYLSTENEFGLSKKGNIVTILSDAFEGGYFRSLLKTNPEIKEDLKDFTYYTDTTGISSHTHLSIPGFFSDTQYPVGKEKYQGVKEVLESTKLFDQLHNEDYTVKMFTDHRYMKPQYENMFDNLVVAENKTTAKVDQINAKRLYKYAFFRYAPHVLKKRFVMDTAEFDKSKQYLPYPTYLFDDIAFNKGVQETGFSANEEKGTFAFYHLYGVHKPNTMNSAIEKVKYPAGTPAKERLHANVLGEMKLLKNMLDSMKKAGVYDNTTIIYTADHGLKSRYDTVLLIKPAGEHSDFRISKAPISLAADYSQFVLDLAGGRDPALYKIPENQPRDRYVYTYLSNNSNFINPVSCKTTSLVRGPANKNGSYSVFSDEFAPEKEPEQTYNLGDKIPIKGEAKNAWVTGFFTKSGNGYTKSAKVYVNLKKPAGKELTVQVKLLPLETKGQTMKVTVGGTTVFEGAAQKDGVEFKVPLSLLGDQRLKMDFSFPNAKREVNKLGYVTSTAYSFDHITIQ